jgi:hypothetical protein
MTLTESTWSLPHDRTHDLGMEVFVVAVFSSFLLVLVLMIAVVVVLVVLMDESRFE